MHLPPKTFRKTRKEILKNPQDNSSGPNETLPSRKKLPQKPKRTLKKTTPTSSPKPEAPQRGNPPPKNGSQKRIPQKHDSPRENPQAPRGSPGENPQAGGPPQRGEPQKAPQRRTPKQGFPKRKIPKHEAPQEENPQARGSPRGESPSTRLPKRRIPKHEAPQEETPQARAPQEENPQARGSPRGDPKHELPKENNTPDTRPQRESPAELPKGDIPSRLPKEENQHRSLRSQEHSTKRHITIYKRRSTIESEHYRLAERDDTHPHKIKSDQVTNLREATIDHGGNAHNASRLTRDPVPNSTPPTENKRLPLLEKSPARGSPRGESPNDGLLKTTSNSPSKSPVLPRSQDPASSSSRLPNSIHSICKLSTNKAKLSRPSTASSSAAVSLVSSLITASSLEDSPTEFSLSATFPLKVFLNIISPKQQEALQRNAPRSNRLPSIFFPNNRLRTSSLAAFSTSFPLQFSPNTSSLPPFSPILRRS
ncbi:proteoglycan 4-like [Penaeus monodon]|uniref:proteoglycan 4-like n=1 Tax=Penaeus monodon TaxID=6687 RepID=UPI0018A766FF|nr:proteoglycan 4-like [Penaeus monodon]